MASPGSNGDDTVTIKGNAPIKPEVSQSSTPTFPPPKTDKPRPHVCQTCGRSFARLEHLKRHERSHTKEKPFECQQCTRCFARRDLLLRHQQKLHQSGVASTRPRNGRRESTSGVNGNGVRGRKNSIASSVVSTQNGTNSSTMRPRANTISHIDVNSLHHFINHTRPDTMMHVGHHHHHHHHHPSLSGLPTGGFDLRPMHSFGQQSGVEGLPKLNTSGLGNDVGGGLRTAPIPMVGDRFDLDKLFASTSTVNPAQLHFGSTMATPTSPFTQGFPPLPSGLDDDDTLEWTNGIGETLMTGVHENMDDGSSPSAISTNSQSTFSEVMVDGSNNPALSSAPMWANAAMVTSAQYPVNAIGAAVFSPDMGQQPNTVSPKELHEQGISDGLLFSNAPGLTTMSPTSMASVPQQLYQPPMTFGSDTTSVSSNSIAGSGGHSSVTSVSTTDSITDATRQALLFTLSQHSGFGRTARQVSHTTLASPLSPPFTSSAASHQVSLPSTADLRRFVNAYITYFHPHMPFLHIPTLSFDSPVFTNNVHSNMPYGDGTVGGGGCLVLAMAAIGAAYEFEPVVAQELSDVAKKMISMNVAELRKASQHMPVSSGGDVMSHPKTPLWLVQAMLLNLIYGHQCGDKVVAEIAMTHCAALVSLAKSAELERPDPNISSDEARFFAVRNSVDDDADIGDDCMSPRSSKRSNYQEMREEHAEWYRWKSQEERKRTLFSVFALSSLLVTAYNDQPRILNSELHLDLPCEEDLWAAESPQTWIALGGAASAQAKAVSFAEALTFLLTASQRQKSEHRLSAGYHVFGSLVPLEEVPESELKPSTFGCYILILALHVYIWETRQRHQGRQWKTHETEQMYGQVEPALRAWQAAWKSNAHHTLNRPNPYGPLPADSIPLLDLAYVRLFVNLGRSKEAFWMRDFEAMAEELERGSEIIQHADMDPSKAVAIGVSKLSLPSQSDDILDMADDSYGNESTGRASKRERQLRRAAFYAADSLSMADELGVTFAEFTSRELPITAAMCTFDCAQVLAEWISSVQDRVGKYLGVLGRDDIDLTQVPAIVLLEEEDGKLLCKINEILRTAEMKVSIHANAIGTTEENLLGEPNYKLCGYGSKLLLVTGYMLEKAAVWGIMRVMAQAMKIHAEALRQAADASLAV